MGVEQVDSINAQSIEARLAGFLDTLGRCVDSDSARIRPADAKFSGEEDVVSLSRPLEPLAHQQLAVAIETAGLSVLPAIQER